ncbi:MAG: hypothetical protein JRJ38_03990 [Deltaproteobacteria bacterium]|nr:hypothetical protein [Deltaproteobacteria bacterium]
MLIFQLNYSTTQLFDDFCINIILTLPKGKSTHIDPEGSRFKVQGSRFKVQGSRFKVQGSRFKVQGSRFKVQGSKVIVY